MENLWPKCTVPKSFRYAENNLTQRYMEGDSRRLSNDKETRTVYF